MGSVWVGGGRVGGALVLVVSVCVIFNESSSVFYRNVLTYGAAMIELSKEALMRTKQFYIWFQGED